MSSSRFCDWKTREATGPTSAQADEAKLVEHMKAISDSSDGANEVPRMCRALRNEGFVVNHKRVHRLMRCHGMAGRAFRRRVRTTIPAGEEFFIPDRTRRRFAPGSRDIG